MATTRTPLPDLPIVRKGIDPEALAEFLDELIARSDAALATADARVAELEKELSEAQKREEAVHMTYVAATKTKQELVEATEREVARKRAGAEEEATQIVADARTEALILLNNAKAEADRLIEIAGEESRKLAEDTAVHKAELATRTATLTQTVAQLEDRLRKIAEGALNHTGALKAEIEQDLARYPDLSTSDSAPPLANRAAASEPVAAKPTAAPSPGVDEEPDARRSSDRRPALESTADDGAARADRQQERPLDEEDAEAVLTDREPGRGSFYSRRSARLPRIGTDNHALEVVSKMRTRTRDTGLDRTDEEDEESLAIQNA